MPKTILSSVLVTSVITFSRTTINATAGNTVDFVILWTQSWIIAATISSVFNLYVIPFLFKKKKRQLLKRNCL